MLNFLYKIIRLRNLPLCGLSLKLKKDNLSLVALMFNRRQRFQISPEFRPRVRMPPEKNPNKCESVTVIAVFDELVVQSLLLNF